MSISLDSAIKSHHEYLRGPNTFDKTLLNIRNLSKGGVNFGISTTIYKQNMDDLEKLIILVKQYNASFVSFILLDKVGRAKINKDLYLNKEEALWVSSNIKKLKLKYAKEISINFLDPLKPNYKYHQQTNQNSHVFCSAGTVRCAIASDGNVYPCVYGFDLEDTKAGSILEESLNSLWNTAR